MSRHAKTDLLIEEAKGILADCNPMTVRQVYYQLVSRQVIKNCRGSYTAVSKALVAARCEGIIAWDWMEDRTRRPRSVSMWDGLADFGKSALASYRLDVWATQPRQVEVWLEKDALSGIFEAVLNPYGVTLNVGRGYDGWDSIHNAAERFGDGEYATVLYFGDFDPSGEDMVRSLDERLVSFACMPEIVKIALTLEDIDRYHLPPDFAKKTDTRAAKFIEANGDVSVELDALPVDVLRERIVTEVEKRMDLEALQAVKTQEKADRDRLAAMLAGGQEAAGE